MRTGPPSLSSTEIVDELRQTGSLKGKASCTLNFLFSDCPGMISWKKLNRGNLLRFPDLNTQRNLTKLSRGHNGLLHSVDARG